MSKIKVIISAAAALTAAAAFSLSADAASAGVVSTASTGLTVRSMADTSSARLASLPKGSLVTLISKNGSWWYVKYADGRYGYCHGDYITELTSGKSGYVDTESGRLNVRRSGSLSSSVVTRLEKGDEVVALSESGGWSRILYNGDQTGYVSTGYLSFDGRQPDGGSTGGNDSGYGGIFLTPPDYKQYDPRWADLKVGRSGKTMRSIGCVTAALAAAESYRTGDGSLTPARMLSKLSYDADGDVAWPSNYRNYTSGGYLEKTYQLLQSKRPVIFGAKTSSGRMHWVVVTGYDGSGQSLSADDFIINDPGSETRKRLSDLFAEYPRFYKIEYYV